MIPSAGNRLVTHVAAMVAYYAYASQTWNIAAGLCGQFSVTHVIWQGIAGYCTVAVSTVFGLPIWTGIILTIVITGLLSYLVGMASSKLLGLYFVMCTLAVNQMVNTVAINWNYITGGNNGLGLNSRFAVYRDYLFYVFLAMAVAVFALFVWIRKSRFGSMMVAVRENELFAQSLGMNTARVRMSAFMISSVLAGLGGYPFVLYTLMMHPSQLSATISMKVMVITMVGGIGTTLGPALGCIIAVLDEVIRMTIGAKFAPVAVIVYACVLISMVMFKPRGLASIKFFIPKQKPSVLKAETVSAVSGQRG